MTLPIRDFVIQRLLEFDPTIDVGSGVPTTGLMIDPLSVILQPVIDELTVVQASQSVLTILESNSPDAFPEDIVDGLASNVFVERNVGSIGSTVERIRFFAPQDLAARKGVLIFRGSAGQRFTNAQPVSITKAEMALNQEGALFYVDIPIRALSEGAAFNVPAGSITTMEAEPAGVANVTNLFKVDQGRNRETNTELIDRIKVAVTVRALVTGRGIIVTLTENFTTIEEIQPIGFKDPEMMRDIVYNVHIGGNVDVYIKTSSFVDGSKDVFGLEVDPTRRRSATVVMCLPENDIGYSLGHASVDRTIAAPVVTPIDLPTPYVEGVDYSISDATGLISRPASSSIVRITGSGADVTGPKQLTKTGAFLNAREGMLLTIDTPATVAGTYMVKRRVDVNVIEIYGQFPIASETAVGFAVNENLSITYQYNPISVDIIKAVRASARAEFTITDVPLMDIVSIEVLDPLSGDPTGVTLTGTGGFGAGGFGEGGFGVGTGMDWQFVVEKPTLRYSWSEDNYIEFSDLLVGASVRINYRSAPAIPPVQAYMNDRDNQSETASLLARHFIPVFVDATAPIVYDIKTSTVATAITVDQMTAVVKKAIDGVDEGRALEISDLVDLMYNNGATRVALNMQNLLRGEIHNQDGSILFTLPDDAGDMKIPNDPIPDPTDRPLSPRIARFKSRNITLARNVVP